MTILDTVRVQNIPLVTIQEEGELLSRYIQLVQQAGIRSDQSSIVNFYVSLKSKPLVILSGPEGSSKEVLVRCLARLLFGNDCYQRQMLLGHPWWAERSSNLPFLTQLHNRFNSEKILSMLEEATQLENRQRVYLASLMNISPAELASFFEDVGFQVQRQEIIRFGDIHLLAPVPFPSNIRLIGTIDRSCFNLWSPDLLSGASVIHWEKPGKALTVCPVNDDTLYMGEKVFLKSCLQETSAAYYHLQNVLGRQYRAPLEPLFEIKALIERHYVSLPPRINNDVIIYLANAWSSYGLGLFDPNTSVNFDTALDYAISQLILPWIILDQRKSVALFKALKDYCFMRFPVTYEQVKRLE